MDWLTILLALLLAPYHNHVALALDQKVVTERVNQLRKLHRAQEVSWSFDLEVEARIWAIHIGATQSFAHDANTANGENLAMYFNYRVNDTALTLQAVNDWYAENADFVYERPLDNLDKTGHFTQLVWAATTQIGAAVYVSDRTSQSFVVMRFSPKGNNLLYFEQNVLSPHAQNVFNETSLPAPMCGSGGNKTKCACDCYC